LPRQLTTMSSKPSSVRSSRSSYHEASESSPLLSNDPQPLYSSSSARPPSPPARHRQPRWASIVALSVLCGCIFTFLVVGFFFPSAAETYAQEAAILDISSLSVDSFTANGVRVRVQATAKIDAHRVRNWSVRILGRVGTAVVGSVRVDKFDLYVCLLDYGNALLGTAQVPGISIDIRNGHSNKLDFVANAKPGSLDTIRLLASDYMTGSLKAIRVVGEVEITVRKGLFHKNLGKITQGFTLTGEATCREVECDLTYNRHSRSSCI